MMGDSDTSGFMDESHMVKERNRMQCICSHEDLEINEDRHSQDFFSCRSSKLSYQIFQSPGLHWEIAKEPLNYGVDCVRNCGIGPGMAFANAVLKKDPKFGVIGLVPCSVSGKGIRWWSHGNMPYEQLLRKVKISLRDGGELRGLLWFHGESDIRTEFDATHYKSNLQKFIHDLRTDLNSPLLPLLMVILHVPSPWFKGKFGDIVRQAQIEVELSNVVKVDANGLPLNPDGIHLTTAAQIRVGNMLADAFLSSNLTSPRKYSNKVYHMMSST